LTINFMKKCEIRQYANKYLGAIEGVITLSR